MSAMKKKPAPALINPDDYRTITEAARELGVDRSRVVRLTRELLPDETPRLPTRTIFGVQVIHVEDLDRVCDRKPGSPRQVEG